jgi:hypothetical protein
MSVEESNALSRACRGEGGSHVINTDMLMFSRMSVEESKALSSACRVRVGVGHTGLVGAAAGKEVEERLQGKRGTLPVASMLGLQTKLFKTNQALLASVRIAQG